jgi:hypothetical protein
MQLSDFNQHLDLHFILNTYRAALSLDSCSVNPSLTRLGNTCLGLDELQFFNSVHFPLVRAVEDKVQLARESVIDDRSIRSMHVSEVTLRFVRQSCSFECLQSHCNVVQVVFASSSDASQESNTQEKAQIRGLNNKHCDSSMYILELWGA